MTQPLDIFLVRDRSAGAGLAMMMIRASTLDAEIRQTCSGLTVRTLVRRVG